MTQHVTPPAQDLTTAAVAAPVSQPAGEVLPSGRTRRGGKRRVSQSTPPPPTPPEAVVLMKEPDMPPPPEGAASAGNLAALESGPKATADGSQLEGMHRFIPPVLYRWPSFTQHPRHELATLFIDVAGFTALSEALAVLGAEGAEILEHTIARYFNALLEHVEAYQGLPIKVSGDALTVVFPDLEHNLDRAALRALTCASRLRPAGLSVATVQLPSGIFSLAHKIGVGVGSMLTGKVGDPKRRQEYVFAGDALEQAVHAEHHAKGGQVWVSPELQARVGQASWFGNVHADGYARLLESAEPESLYPPDAFHGGLSLGAADVAPPPSLDVLVPAVVREHAAQGTLNYLCRHQVITVMFAGCPKLRLESPDSFQQLDAHYRRMQQIIEQFGGFLSEFEAGDKGSKLIVMFGSPTSLEDPAGQAARCASAMQAAAKEMGIVGDQRIGMTSGRLYVGRIGCSSLVKYSALGDRMNLAARLMAAAGRWTVLAEKQTVERSRGDVRWGEPRTLKVKGKNEPVSVSALRRSRSLNRRDRRGRGILGRKTEQGVISKAFDQLKNGRGGLVMLSGEAGIGKTRLMEYVRRLAREQNNLPVQTWSGSPQLVESPLSAISGLLSEIVRISPNMQEAQAQATFETWLAQQPESCKRNITLLGQVLGLELTLDPVLLSLPVEQLQQLRQGAAVEMLQRELGQQPRILIFDGAERMDTASLAVLSELSVSLPHKPVLVVLTARPAGQELSAGLAALAKRPDTVHLELKPLTPKDALRLAARRLKVKHIDSELAALLQSRSNNNPLLLESWVTLLQERGLLQVLNDKAFLRGVQRLNELPDRFEALVLTQLERLPPEAQLTVLVASVMGIPFTAAEVAELHPQGLSELGVSSHLRLANRAELIWYDRGRPGYVLFPRSEVREAIHDSMPFHLRRSLHTLRAARLIAQAQGHFSPELLLLLAAHYEYVEAPEEQAHYYAEAMKVCRERGDTEGVQRWGRRILGLGALAPGNSTRLEAFAATSDALSRRGENEERVNLTRQWATEARDASALASLSLALRQHATGLERLSRADEALGVLEEAIAVAESLHDRVLQTETMVQLSMIHGENGRADKALEWIERASTTYPGEHPELMMRIFSNQGFVLNQLNRPKEAHAAFVRALALSEESGNIYVQGVLVGNMGIELWSMGYPQEGHETLLRGLELKRRVGDRREIGLTLLNVGFSFCKLGELSKARSFTEEACQLFLHLNYGRGAIYALSNLGEILTLLSDFEAAEHRYAEAQALLDKGPHLGLQLELWLRQGELALAQHDIPVALSWFDRALASCTKPSHVHFRCNAHEGRAMAFIEQRELEQARIEIEEALKLLESGCNGLSFPQRVWWRAHLIFAALKQGERAEQCAEKGWELMEKELHQLQGAAARTRLARAWPWSRGLNAWKRVKRVKAVSGEEDPALALAG